MLNTDNHMQTAERTDRKAKSTYIYTTFDILLAESRNYFAINR